MTRRILDDAGAAWPITGHRCPICKLPADPSLDHGPHPSCTPATRRPVAAVLSPEQVAAVLHAEVLGAFDTRWQVSRAPLPPPAESASSPDDGTRCTDCGLPLPIDAGPGVHVRLACWQPRGDGPVPPATRGSDSSAPLPSLSTHIGACRTGSGPLLFGGDDTGTCARCQHTGRNVTL